MLVFTIRRLFSMIPLLFGVSLLVFFLMYLAPGDFLDQARHSKDVSPAVIEKLERQYGLKDADGKPNPWFFQYACWLNSVSPIKFINTAGKFTAKPHFGSLYPGESWVYLGESWTYKIPVTDLIGQRVWATFLLSITSLAFSWIVAIPLGVLAAIYKDSLFDRISSLLAYASLSIPSFFLALVAVNFAAVTGWLPTGGLTAFTHPFMSPVEQCLDIGKHLILPTLVLGIGGVAGMMRIMRANFLDYMRADFATTARAKGLSETVIMFKHVLRNAINPLITSFGFAFSSLLSGSLLVEKVMNYPGLGQLIYEAFIKRDPHVVMTGVLLGTLMLMLGNLISDLLLAWSDPRIRLEDTSKKSGILSKTTKIISVIVFILIFGIAVQTAFPEFYSFTKITLSYGLIAVAIIGGVAAIALVIYLLYQLAKRLLKPLLSRPSGAFAFTTLSIFYLLALGAHWLAPYPVSKQNLDAPYHPPTRLFLQNGELRVQAYINADRAAARYEPIADKSWRVQLFSHGKLFHLDTPEPSARIYILGADTLGRDVFSRLLHGARISLTIGLVGITITLFMGFLVGGLAGYFGGTFDFIAMRLTEFLMAIPGLYLLLALRAALMKYFESDQMYFMLIVILSFIGWTGAARILRGMSLSLRNRPFVHAAESMGQSTLSILTRHFLPNLASYLLVAATLSIPGYILGEAALSFLGLGISEPDASWGLMLKNIQEDPKVFMLGFWWMLAPGIAIFTTVICFNLLGDVLRDIVDPRMKT